MKNKLILNAETKNKLLTYSRAVIEGHIKNKDCGHIEENELFIENGKGIFVTIKVNNKLRGCMGLLFLENITKKIIKEVSLNSVTNDPRFPPVTEEELNDLQIEISLLYPMEKIYDIEEIYLGTHGLFIKKGSKQGLLLPQVAVDNNFDKVTFLEHTCMKAGLAKSTWKNSETNIFIFKGEKFTENKF